MIQTKKVDAFTLSEMLVVLVVSSIVISITFMVLQLVQKQVRTIRTNFKKQQQVVLLDRLLWQDFNSHNVHYNQSSDFLVFTNNIDTIQYAFYSDFVVRQTDTIKTAITNKALFLNGATVTNGTIDAITLYTEKLYDSNKIFAYKQKDAAYYLNK